MHCTYSTMQPPRTTTHPHQALLEDMKMLEDEFGLAEMATPERDDDPNSLNGDPHDPHGPHCRPSLCTSATLAPRARAPTPVGPPVESPCMIPLPSPRVARSAGRCPRRPRP